MGAEVAGFESAYEVLQKADGCRRIRRAAISSQHASDPTR